MNILQFDEDGNPYIDVGFTEYQLQVAQDLYDNDNGIKYQLLRWARRTGKSAYGVRMALVKAFEKPDSRVALIGLTHSQTEKTLKRAMLEILHPSLIKKINKSSNEIVLINNTIIQFGSGQRPENFQGQWFNFVVIDEIGNQRPELWTQYIYPTLLDKDGDALLLGTFKGLGDDWVDNLIGKLPSFRTYEMSVIESGLYSEEQLKNMKLNALPKEWEQEFLGMLVANTGLVYSEFDKDKNIKSQAFQPYADLWIAQDFNVDPMALMFIQRDITDFKKFVVVDTFLIKDTNTWKVCQYLINLLSQRQFQGNLIYTGDFSGNQRRTSADGTDWTIIKESFRNFRNFRVIAPPTKSIVGRVNRTNSAFHKSILSIDPSCKELINELYTLVYKDDGSIDSKGDKMGHITDALSYFCKNFINLTDKVQETTWY